MVTRQHSRGIDFHPCAASSGTAPPKTAIALRTSLDGAVRRDWAIHLLNPRDNCFTISKSAIHYHGIEPRIRSDAVSPIINHGHPFEMRGNGLR